MLAGIEHERTGLSVVQESAGCRNAGRGYGLADMAAAIAAGTPHRASGELAFHVLDIMESILTASASGHVVELSSTAGRPPCRCPTRRETQQEFRS